MIKFVLFEFDRVCQWGSTTNEMEVALLNPNNSSMAQLYSLMTGFTSATTQDSMLYSNEDIRAASNSDVLQ